MSKIVNEYINTYTINQVIQMTHGYFRHTNKNEKNEDNPNYTSKWQSYNDEEKLKRMNNLIIHSFFV